MLRVFFAISKANYTVKMIVKFHKLYFLIQVRLRSTTHPKFDVNIFFFSRKELGVALNATLLHI